MDNLSEPIASRRADTIGGIRGAHTDACGRKQQGWQGRPQTVEAATKFELRYFSCLSPSSLPRMVDCSVAPKMYF